VTVADLLTYLAAGIALLAAIGRYRSIRPAAPTPAQRHLLIALAAIAPALVFVAPATQAATAPLDPFPYTTQLASSALAMLASYCVVAMLAHVVAETGMTARRCAGHLATLLAAIATMTGLLLAADVEFTGNFTSDAARHPLLAAHQVVYLGYLGSRITRFIRLMRRYVSRPDARPLMRRGMLVVLLAAVVGLLWLAWNLLTMAMIHIGRPLVPDPATVAHLLGATAATLMALGATLPAWGGWLHRTIDRCRVNRALRGITPLWRLLATELPDITLPQPTRTHPELLLYRRIIEIRDAQRRLLGYIPPGIDAHIRRDPARKHRLDTITIRTEAAALAAALDAHRVGCRQPGKHARMRYPETTQPTRLAEARWLIRVHTAMRYDPAVARAVDWGRRQLAPRMPGPAPVPRQPCPPSPDGRPPADR
jgi:hypothetical protein